MIYVIPRNYILCDSQNQLKDEAACNLTKLGHPACLKMYEIVHNLFQPNQIKIRDNSGKFIHLYMFMPLTTKYELDIHVYL